jgi:hypothetical protein
MTGVPSFERRQGFGREVRVGTTPTRQAARATARPFHELSLFRTLHGHRTMAVGPVLDLYIMRCFIRSFGGRTRTRTWDPLIKSQLIASCISTQTFYFRDTFDFLGLHVSRIPRAGPASLGVCPYTPGGPIPSAARKKIFR